MSSQHSESKVTVAELIVDGLQLLLMVVGLIFLIAIYQQSKTTLEQARQSIERADEVYRRIDESHERMKEVGKYIDEMNSKARLDLEKGQF